MKTEIKMCLNGSTFYTPKTAGWQDRVRGRIAQQGADAGDEVVLWEVTDCVLSQPIVRTVEKDIPRKGVTAPYIGRREGLATYAW